MFYGFTWLDVLSFLTLIIALLLLRNKEKEDIKRLVTIVLTFVIVAGVLYEAARLYLAAQSTDYLSRVACQALVVALLGKLTEEKCLHPNEEYVEFGAQVFHVVVFAVSIGCLFFTILLRA
jgi:VanZ family protein